jgi:hypothetical protein
MERIKTEDKIMSYLNEQDEIVIGGAEELQHLEDDELFEKMNDFINSLDPNKLLGAQSEELERLKNDLAKLDDKKGQEK